MRTVAARDRDAIGMSADLNYAFLLGSRFRQFLNTPRASQNLSRAANAILSDIAPDWTELRMAISWLIQTGQFAGMDRIEDLAIKHIKLSAIRRDLSSVFSTSVMEGVLAFLAGYLELELNDATTLLPPPVPLVHTPSGCNEEDEESKPSVISPSEAAEIYPYLPAPPLEGDNLFDAIRRLGDIDKNKLVARCGYYKRNEDGSISPLFSAFYESLLLAKFRQVNPGSTITSWPVEVDGNPSFLRIRINRLIAGQCGLAVGYYRITNGYWDHFGNYCEDVILSPLNEQESEEWASYISNPSLYLSEHRKNP